MNYLLGIDGGGTKTDLLLTDEFGQEIARTSVKSTSLVAVGEEAAKQNLIQGLKQVCAVIQEPDYVIKMAVFGLASVDTDQEEDQAAKIFQPIMTDFKVEEFAVMNDAVLALVNGTDQENAIVLISGTGSNCYGENEAGEIAKTGGLDHLLSDEGSGYELGRQVLRAAVKSFDGRGDKTVLEELTLDYFSVETAPDLKSKVYHPTLGKPEISAVSKLLFKALEQNDAVALALFNQAASELWLMVKTVAEKLKLDQDKFDLVLSGSMAKSAVTVRYIQQQLQEFNPQANLILPKQSPVYGALKLLLE